MQELEGKVAVVTGAASGIGRALAERFAAEGMRVVLADVETRALAAVGDRVRAAGAEAIDVVTDVSDPRSVEALAERCQDAFGACHVLCNNAGVLAGGTAWETPLEDWQWVLGVNLYGVIHGVRAFVPRMLAQQSEGHVVNVASMAGLTSVPYATVYHVSKHAVVTYSECLYKELAAAQSKIGVSVLCPELVDTAIADAARNRPATLRAASTATGEMIVKATSAATRTGLPPAVMAERVVRGIRERRFYLLAEDDTWLPMAKQRAEDVIAGRNPSLALPAAP